MKDQELNFEGIEKLPLKSFTERAYLDYSMYVILDRALPAIADRIITSLTAPNGAATICARCRAQA